MKRKKEREDMSSILIFDEIASRFEIGGNHLFDQVIKGDFAFPSKNFLGFARITEQEASRGKWKIINGIHKFQLKSTYSTSAGRKYLGSILTTVFPVFLSIACSCSALPDHLMKIIIKSEIRERKERWNLPKFHANFFECLFREFSYGMHFTRRKDKVVSLRLL